MALLSSILQLARKKEQSGFSALLSFLAQAKDTATRTIKPVSDFYKQTNDQRQQDVGQFVDTNVSNFPLVRPLAKVAGNLLFAGQLELPPVPTDSKTGKVVPYSQWSPELRKKYQQAGLMTAMAISGKMEDRALGRLAPKINLFDKGSSELQPAKKALQLLAPKGAGEIPQATQGPGQALSKAGVPEAQLAQNEAVRALQQASPRGLLGESYAQTAFRREAQLTPGQVYDAPRFAKQMEAKAVTEPIFQRRNLDLNKRAGVADYMSTPEYVLERMGLNKEMSSLRSGLEAAEKELPQHIDQIKKWQSVAPGPESSARIFDHLDGKNVSLLPNEQIVADEMKAYFQGWAKRLKLPQDHRLSSYVTHIFELSKNGQEFDDEIARVIADKIPGSTYNPFTRPRAGQPDFIRDAWRSAEAYAKRAVRAANMDPALEAIEKVSDTFDPTTYKYVQRFISQANFRPSELDSLIDTTVKQSPIGYRLSERPTALVTGKIRRMIYRAALGLNPKAALINLTQTVNTYSRLGEKNTALGLFDFMKKAATGGLGELEEVGVLSSRFIGDRELQATKSLMDKVDPILFSMFDFAEKFNRATAYYGGRREALAKGLTDQAAIDYAKRIVRETQFNFSRIDTPLALGSDWVKTLGQFMTYPVKQTEFLLRMAKDKNWGGILRFIGASFVVANTYGKVVGMSQKDFIPFIEYITGSRGFQPPVLQIAGEGRDIVKTLLDPAADADQKKRQLLESGKRIGALTVPAGGQIRKALEGYQAYEQGRSVSPSGMTRFRIKKNSPEALRSVLLGQYSTAGGQEYLKTRNPLSKAEFRFQEWEELKKSSPQKADNLADLLEKQEPDTYRGMVDLFQARELGLEGHKESTLSKAAFSRWTELRKTNPKEADKFADLAQSRFPDLYKKMTDFYHDEKQGAAPDRIDAVKKKSAKDRTEFSAEIIRRYPKQSDERDQAVKFLRDNGVIDADVYSALLLLQKEGKL